MSHERPAASASKPRKKFVGKSTATPSKKSSSSFVSRQIPADLLADPVLNAAIGQLPANYSFEIHKTVHQIRKNGAKMVALQMPEGLQMFACAIADIIEQFTPALTVIMGDVTYGACCIDDYTALALGCDMLVHYGHSCLVPIDTTSIKTLYVFVEIGIDLPHLVQTVRFNFPDNRKAFHENLLASEEEKGRVQTGSRIGVGRHLRIDPTSVAVDRRQDDIPDPDSAPVPLEPTRLALVSTIQFVTALSRLKDNLESDYEAISSDHISAHGDSNTTSILTPAPPPGPGFWTGRYDAIVPRSKPLSPGEILGCTAPSLQDVDALIYLGDGRFHLESIMIANPSVPAFRYDPYSKKLTRERYNHVEMKAMRDNAVQSARSTINSLPDPNREATCGPATTIVHTGIVEPVWGVVLGTLGRQGSFKQLQAITNQLKASRRPIPYVTVLLSELSPAKLALFKSHISTFVQTSCPRLSIDWGHAFHKPLLSPYETAVALGKAKGWNDSEERANGGRNEGTYPMNFYEASSPWAVARAKAAFD